MSTTNATSANATYEDVLAQAKRVGASKASDEGVIALFCDSPALHLLCGAVSAKLVFEGARTKGLSAVEFAHLVNSDPKAVEDLMWL